MKTSMKAILASVVVIALALSAISGITYSWWSDEESGQVNITTGGLSVDTGAFYVAHLDATEPYYQSETIPTDFSIKYGGTGTATLDLEKKGLNPDNLNVVIIYTVTYKSTVDAKYMSNVIIPDGVTATMNITDGSSSTVIPGKYYEMTPSGTEEKVELSVRIAISKIDMDVSGKFIFTNYITQKNNSNAINGEGDVSAGSATVGNTSGTYVKADDLPSDANKFGVTVTTDDSRNKATLDLSLVDSSGNKITTFTSNVKVTTVLDGNYNTLYFNGTGEQPTYTCTYNSTNDKTTITFTTSHFSKFVACVDTTIVSSSDEFDAAVNNADTKTIALLSDITVNKHYQLDSRTLAIDLNGNELTYSNTVSSGDQSLFTLGYVNVKVSPTEDDKAKKSTLTIMDGRMSLNGTSSNAGVICVGTGSSLYLESLDIESSGPIFPNGDATIVKVKDSKISSYGNYVLGTNASKDDNGNVSVEFDNCELSVYHETSEGTDGDSTTVYINTKGTRLTITDSELIGQRQALMVRAGAATVSGSMLICDLSDGAKISSYLSGGWGTGNEVPEFPVVVGDTKNTAYNDNASLTLKDTTIINKYSGTESGVNARCIYMADDEVYSAILIVEDGVKFQKGESEATALSSDDIAQLSSCTKIVIKGLDTTATSS